MQYILASASPRRERLLHTLLRRFSVQPAKISERLVIGEAYPRACVRLARKKAEAVAGKVNVTRRGGKETAVKEGNGMVVIGVDTIAYLGKRIFRKTDNERKARAILRFLSGKTHTVATGVCVIFPNGKTVAYCERARVRMRKITPEMLDSYMKVGEWKGRAGSYDVSGKGAQLVERVKGEKETVVGLPLKKLRQILPKTR